MDFDLKDFRQNVLKMTQTEFAKLIDVRQDNISRMEKAPEAIDIGILVKIANATGTSLDELVGYKQSLPEALQVSNSWKQTASFRSSLLNYIQEHKQQLANYAEPTYKRTIDEFTRMVESTITKPTVAVVGMSDAGKSRLINSLIGSDKMPTSWTPTTSINIHIKHIDERPTFLRDETLIFREDKSGFDTKKISDEQYCKKWLLASGPASILAEYGTRQGDQYDISDVSTAVIFVDSPILQTCHLVDLPGFRTGDRQADDVLAQKSYNFADIVIYLSIANGFLRASDIEFLKSTLNSLPVIENKHNKVKPLNNLFVLASQAHTVNNGNKSELERILDAGADRLYQSIPDEIWENRTEQSGQQHTVQQLRERFFTYTTDKPYLRDAFEQQLTNLLEQLPAILNEEAVGAVENYAHYQKGQITKEINQLKDIIKQHANYQVALEEIEDNEPVRLFENNMSRLDVVNEINNLHTEALREFKNDYVDIISIDHIVNVIDDKQYKRNKEHMELLSGYLSSQLQARSQNILKTKSEQLNDVIDQYLDDFEVQITKVEGKLKGFEIPFDTVRVFASGLAGLATFGGLAFWASTLGNLGAYILIAKGVSVLSALGISVAGGTAGAASAVATLGGPITLGVALAVIVSLSVFALSTGRWKKSVAKKIVNEYSKQDAFNQFADEIETFWDETEHAFEVAADHLEAEWQKYVANLNEKVNNYDEDTIQANIYNLEQLHDFFANIKYATLLSARNQ